MCTWEGCDRQPKHKQIARDGQVWANLCDVHKEVLKHAGTRPHRFLMAAWIKAQGGASKAVERSQQYAGAQAAKALLLLLTARGV